MEEQAENAKARMYFLHNVEEAREEGRMESESRIKKLERNLQMSDAAFKAGSAELLLWKEDAAHADARREEMTKKRYEFQVECNTLRARVKELEGLLVRVLQVETPSESLRDDIEEAVK